MLLLSVLPTLYDWARMQWWQPVPATLVARLRPAAAANPALHRQASYHHRYQVAGRGYQGTA